MKMICTNLTEWQSMTSEMKPKTLLPHTKTLVRTVEQSKIKREILVYDAVPKKLLV
jgi:hypothetical protein